jgi:hypothetical protein
MKFMIREGVSEEYFRKYLDAGVSSHHIYKTKEDHEYAVLLLASELSRVLAKTYDDIPQSVSVRFEKLAERARKRRSSKTK